MKTPKNTWFTVGDPLTTRLEFIAFSGLGLAGAILIAAATIDSWRFAQHREQIIQAWSTPGPATVELAPVGPNRTNFVRLEVSQPWLLHDASP